MPLAQLRIALWVLLALGLGAISTWVGMRIYASGAASRNEEVATLTQRLANLTATTTAASAEALRRQQEAAHATRKAEDEAQRQVDAAQALAVAAQADRESGAAEYRERVRTATARACSGGKNRRDDVPRAAESRPPAATEERGLSAKIADDLAEFAESVERLNDSYRICYRVVSAGAELIRSR